jgi:hypothetical protein
MVRRSASPQDGTLEETKQCFCAATTHGSRRAHSFPDAIHATHVFTRGRHVTMASGQGMGGEGHGMQWSEVLRGRAPRICIPSPQRRSRTRSARHVALPVGAELPCASLVCMAQLSPA